MTWSILWPSSPPWWRAFLRPGIARVVPCRPVDIKPWPGPAGRARPPGPPWWPVIRGPGIACLVRAWCTWWPWAAQLVQLVAGVADQVAE